MQTFLPFEDFALSARALDRQRLGKQRVETMQIMSALTDPAYGWQNHPAVQMWRGHESWLLGYQSSVCREWTGRGYKDNCFLKTRAIWIAAGSPQSPRPSWLGDPDFHRSHQSNLLRKDPDYYRFAFPVGTPDDLEYIWPSQLVSG